MASTLKRKGFPWVANRLTDILQLDPVFLHQSRHVHTQHIVGLLEETEGAVLQLVLGEAHLIGRRRRCGCGGYALKMRYLYVIGDRARGKGA